MSKRSVSRKSNVIPIVSFPLEDTISTPCKVVGRKTWLESDFEVGVLDNFDVVVVSESSDLAQVKTSLQKHSVLGVDSETTGEDKRSGLDPWRGGSRMVSLQIGTEDMTYLIEPDLAPEFQGILEDKGRLHVFQNALHDFKYLYYKYGIHVENIYDTMLVEQLLTSGLNGLRVGLADIVRRYPPYSLISKQVRNEFITFIKFSAPMVKYAVQDVPIMLPVYRAQIQRLADSKMQVCAQDEFNVIPVTAMMELGGVPLSEKHLRLALKYWEKRQKELEIEIINIYNEELDKSGKRQESLLPNVREMFDLQSPAQKLHVLQVLGFDIKDVQRDTLDLYDAPIMKLLGEYSNVMKITSTYGENLLLRVNPQTGLLHPEFNQLGSGDIEERLGKVKKGTIATGRYASDFQQIPKPTKRFDRVTSTAELELLNKHFGDKISKLGAKHV